VVVLPLVPGMAQYYYEMLEHVHTICARRTKTR
jgi:hypothetical protein